MVKIDIFLVNKRWYLWQRIRSRKILKRFLVLQQKINTWNLEAVHKSLPAPSWNFRNSWIIHYTNIWSWFFLPIFLLFFFLVVWIILENIAELKRKITYPHFEGPLWPSVCPQTWEQCAGAGLLNLSSYHWQHAINQCKTSNIISTCNILLNTIYSVLRW